MKEVGAVLCRIYALRARVVVLDDGICVDGEVPDELKEKARSHRVELLKAITGDPLDELGWEARTALYRQALQWLDGEIEKLELKGTSRERAAIDALCRHDMVDRLNTAWCDGSFDEFREALREYVRAGLHAAKRKNQADKAKRPAVVKAAGGYARTSTTEEHADE